MHVRSSGDLVEITSERDSLAISCDLSEVHSRNHTCSGYAHEHVQTRQFEFIVRIPIAGIVRSGESRRIQLHWHIIVRSGESRKYLICIEISTIT
jgi:hypothetical protein